MIKAYLGGQSSTLHPESVLAALLISVGCGSDNVVLFESNIDEPAWFTARRLCALNDGLIFVLIRSSSGTGTSSLFHKKQMSILIVEPKLY